MGDYDIGSTGVAELHTSFAKPSDLVTLAPDITQRAQSNWKMHKGITGRPSTIDEKYHPFEKYINQQLDGRKRIKSPELNEILEKASAKFGIKATSLKSQNYMGRYIKEHHLTVVTYFNELQRQHEVKYKQFKTVRDKYPNANKAKRIELFRQISKDIDISVQTLRGRTFEQRWQEERK